MSMKTAVGKGRDIAVCGQEALIPRPEGPELLTKSQGRGWEYSQVSFDIRLEGTIYCMSVVRELLVIVFMKTVKRRSCRTN